MPFGKIDDYFKKMLIICLWFLLAVLRDKSGTDERNNSNRAATIMWWIWRIV